jgi:hypothetical protein
VLLILDPEIDVTSPEAIEALLRTYPAVPGMPLNISIRKKL